jgi:autotransporter-associated beta strand protein
MDRHIPRLLTGLACILALAVLWWRAQPSKSTAEVRPPAGQPPTASPSNPPAPPLPVEEAPAACVGGTCNHAEHTRTVAIQEPRKLDLPLDFLDRIVRGDAVAFELPDGRKVECADARIEKDEKGLVSVTGQFTKPVPGTFFFRRQDFPGVAGKMVGNVIFEGEQTAWKVLPEGRNGDPILKEVPIGEVICVGYAPPMEMPQDHPSTVALPEYQDVIPLQSLPGAPGVIYLDFDGSKGPHDTWSYKGDAPPSGFSNSTIRDIWIRVAEDFLPFNLNVTTDAKVYENATRGRRIRCIITPNGWHNAGGVAYVGSYNWGGDPVCWSLNYTGDGAVSVISHEVGHTLGLYHHGYSTKEYYGGHGSGVTAWAPIMGSGYGKNLKQWSRGDYYLATKPNQNDLTTISNQNGVDYRADDCGDTLATARYLAIAPGNTVTNQQGIIERTGEIDAFRFKSTGGAVSLTVSTATISPNLDILAELVNAATGTLVTSSNPTTSLDATISATVPAGEYLLKITGAGFGTPTTSQNGYSNYGCLGSYKIGGSVAGGETYQAFNIAEHSPNGTVLGTVTPLTLTGGPFGYAIASGNTGGILALNASTGSLTVANSSALNYETLSTQYDDPATLELFITVTNTSTAATETVRATVTVTDVNEPPVITGWANAVVFEGTTPGVNVVEISATDPDRFDGPTYSIFSGNDAGHFAINPRTGWITLVNAPEVTDDTPITLVVRATDQKTPQLFASQTLVITFTNLSDTFTGAPGGLYRTFFRNISGANVSDLTGSANFPNSPDQETYLTSFDGGSNQGDNYGSTLRGYLLPPVTGTYNFWVAADNSSQLILAPTAAQAGTPVIASSGTVSQYAWDQTTAQASAPVTLTGGQPYYIELRQKEATGGDHAAVAWSGPGITRQVISGLYLAPFHQNYAPRPGGSLTVAQNALVNAVIGKPTVVEVNSQDTLSNYTITAGNTGNLFSINPTTGEIRLAIAGQFNPAVTPYYDLTVSVSDDGTPALVGTGVVRVTVQLSSLYFDPNGTSAGSVLNGGAYAWRTTSWASVPGGTATPQTWASGSDAFFAATSPAGPLSYTVDITDYNSGTHGSFGAIQALAGTVKLTGNVANFYPTTPLEIKAAPGAAIEFNQTCTANPLLAFNLNTQTATFDGDVTFNNSGIGNSGNIVLNSGSLKLRQPSSYTGTTTLLGGVLNVATLGNYGANGGLGNRAAASEASGNIGLLFRGGTLQYTGATTQTTDRQIRIGTEGGTIDASGSTPTATVSFTHSATNTDLYFSPGDRTLTLTGSNPGANTFAIRLTDQNSTTGQTSLLKTGTGTWVMTGASTHTGGTTILGGTLQFNSPANLPGAVQVDADSNDENLFGTLFMNAGFTTWPQNVSGSGLWKVATGSGGETTALTGNYAGFTGTLEVATGSGKIQLNTAANYPAAGSTLQLDAGTSAFISGGGTFPSRIRMLGGTIGEPTYGQLRISNAATTTLTGGITLLASSTIAVDASRTATISGVISESGGNFGFIKNQPGTLTLNAANTHTGGTIVAAGILQTGTGTGKFGPGNLTVETAATCRIQNTTGALGRQAYVYLNGTGKLDLAGGVTETVARLYINGAQQAPGTYTAANLSTNINGGGSLIVGDAVPAAPTELTAGLPAWNTIQLSWNHVSINETDIRLERSLSPTTGFAEIATLPATATRVTDSGLPVATTYYYRLRVGNSVGYSDYSTVASATTGVSSPPAGLTASAAAGLVNLAWTLNPGAASYNVRRATISGGPYTLLGNTTASTFSDSTVTNGTTYFYIVTSAAAGDESLPSDEVSARPLPLPATGIWAASSGGNWSDVDNWLDFVIADGIGNSATFNQPGGGNVTLDTAGRALSTLNFANGDYSLLGNPFTLDSPTGTPLVTVGTGSTATVTAALSGTSGLTKSGAGRLRLSNSTFTGATTVSAGTLTMLGSHAANAFAIASGATLELDTSTGEKNHIANTFTGAGTLRKSGANRAYWGTAAATFALDSGSLIDVQAGTLTGGSNANEIWTNNKADLNIAAGAIFDGVEANVRVDGISGNGTLKTGYNGAGYANLTIGVDNGSSTFGGVIANSTSTGNLVKQGTGTITLGGNNTFTGGVSISGGVLRITRTGGLGTGTKTVTIKATADKMLELDGTTGNITLPSTISFLTSGVNGAIRNIAGNNTIAGAFTISDGNGNTKIISDGGALTLSGNISANIASRILDLSGTSTAANTFSGALSNTSTPGLTKTGTGTWTLSGANTYAGATTVTAGTLKLAHNSALGSTAAGTTVSTGAKLQLEGVNLNIPENLTLGTGTTGVTIENLGGNNTLSGTITRNGALNFLSTAGKLIISSPIGDTSNTVNLQGDGDGEMNGGITLAFAVTKSGNGTWKLSGTNTYTTATTISAGKLVLTGSLASPVTATSGTLAPQGTPATTSSLAINSTGRLEVRPGDTLTVGGTVTLAGNLDVIAPPGLAIGTSYTILNKSSAGAVGGTFAGKPEAGTFTASGYTWRISYLGGDGNDVTLTIPNLTAIQSWRQLHYGTTANTGSAADTFDANSDGETNLIEFATGQNPLLSTLAVTTVVKTPTGLEFTYTRNRNAFNEGYLFNVEHSDNLIAPWTSVGAGTVFVDGDLQTVKASIPAGPLGSRFVRLKTSPPAGN